MRLSAWLIAILAFLPAACGGTDSSPSPTPGYDIPALQIIDTRVGTGTEATTGRQLTVHYTLWLYSPTAPDYKGTRLESSRDANQPYPFTLGGNVIAGWNQGIQGMRAGGMRTLLIPSNLAYGSSGRSSIPPNSALVFDIELLSVQ